MEYPRFPNWAISLVLFLFSASSSLAQKNDSSEERIVTAEEVRKATRPPSLALLRILSYPHRAISAGMEKGLISFEKHHMRERIDLWRAYLTERGITPLFGGMGEGSGFGGGTVYTLRPAAGQTLEFLGRATFKNYQEFDIQWTQSWERNQIMLETSYQWRPQENFYGLGHGSLQAQRTDFGLRQSWAGVRWESKPAERIRLGVEYRRAWLRAVSGGNPHLSSPDEMFSGLSGFDRPIGLDSAGAYFEADLVRSEYSWGGMAHLGASYQNGFGISRLNYFTYEIQLEGRMPIAAERSALVGQANVELNRERPGSDPLPFFLQPHVGGSSTLRGFALDRFYGKNAVLLALEYRYRVHPNIQTWRLCEWMMAMPTGEPKL